MRGDYLIYVLVMFATTYVIRVVPFTAIRKKITNRFVNDFLSFVPYAVLAAMTIPAMLSSTDSLWSALAGLAVAVFLAIKDRSLIVVALSSCVTVYVVDLVISLL